MWKCGGRAYHVQCLQGETSSFLLSGEVNVLLSQTKTCYTGSFLAELATQSDLRVVVNSLTTMARQTQMYLLSPSLGGWLLWSGVVKLLLCDGKWGS